ncbi:hypothetical protein UlMin_007960 [Ulmus minor]
MTLVDVVDLSSDDELGEVRLKAVKLESGLVGSRVQSKKDIKVQQTKHHLSKDNLQRLDSERNRSASPGQTKSSIIDPTPVLVGDTCVSPTTISPAPLCRQFWKAGNYDDKQSSKVTLQNGRNYIHVHPMFLHSNATSHKWAFGAVAELLDNAVDEIQNGATFVAVDKISNPRDGTPALVVKDDGGGMDPEAMKQCMSFGFSVKKSKSAIGQYGNGFKTSTMRLGGDVIVFSRHQSKRVLTQSIGLLSYTSLRRAGYDRIIVPMVHYEFNTITGELDYLHGKEHFMSNLSMLLQWSPYSTEKELLKQLDDIEFHGTKVMIYNLWCNEDGTEELDFDTDPKDIRISGETKRVDTIPAWKTLNEQHIGNRYHYSLRAYLSILYMRLPAGFKIVLRGEHVEHHNIANDLIFPEFILYKPQTGGTKEGEVLTSIGFLKEAPRIIIHGFNVYHKNRLILPFWQVVRYVDNRGRGVVGVLEANFIEPTHNKQDFERTTLFHKLEIRLKDMQWEYWDYHCHIVGYQSKRKLPERTTPLISSQEVRVTFNHPPGFETPKGLPKSQSRSEQGSGLSLKRKDHSNSSEIEMAKRKSMDRANVTESASQLVSANETSLKAQETMKLLVEENKKLHASCSEFEQMEEELKTKVSGLKSKVEEAKKEYSRLLAEIQAMETLKEEKGV